MKIFVTGPDTDDSFTHNVAHTLAEMGHDVRTDPGEAFEMQKSSLRRGLEEALRRASRRFRSTRDRRALRLAAEFRPELTVMCTLTMQPETVHGIRRASGGRVVLWYGDSPANLRWSNVYAGEYDAVFAKDPDFVGDLRKILGIEAFYLPEACNPAWHRPLTEREGDTVVVAGTSYGYRNALVERLLDAGVEVEMYGQRPGGWVSSRIRSVHTGEFLVQRRKAEVFGRAMACLGTFAPSEGRSSVNCRVFETCACGGLLLAERRDALDRYFERDREYLAFASLEECRDQLERLRADYSQARRIRENAARRARSEHTYRRRLESMLDTLGMA